MRSNSNKKFEMLTFEADTELLRDLRVAANTQRKRPEELVSELVELGLEKSALKEELEEALTSLTRKEHEVLRLIVRGYTNRQIAGQLVVTPETVKTHVRHILTKLRADSKANLRLRLLDLGVRVWEG